MHLQLIKGSRPGARGADPILPRRRSLDDLLQNLLAALLRIGRATQFLPICPPDPDITKDVQEVRDIDRELHRRKVDPGTRLASMNRQPNWALVQLYTECLAIPAVQPWVRDASDGVRIALRCAACRAREFPSHSRMIRLCNECLDRLDRKLCDGLVAGTPPGIDAAMGVGMDAMSVKVYKSFVDAERMRRQLADSLVGPRLPIF